MKSYLLLIGFALCLFAAHAGHSDEHLSAEPSSPTEPSYHRWQSSIETGALWKVGGDSASDYLILPLTATLSTPQHWLLVDGPANSVLVWRGQGRLFYQKILRAPEDYYTGVAFAPVLEWHFESGYELFASAGGGFGITNSQDVEGALGQDFTLNWLARVGAARSVAFGQSTLRVESALFFQHLSNLGMTDPNPGVDSLGLTLGLRWVW